MKYFLYLILAVLLGSFALASDDQFDVCFDYQGNGLYFLDNQGLGYSSEVLVEDLGSTVRITTTLDSLAKPFLAFGEKDRDNDGTVEPDELRSDGIWIDYGPYSYEWIVYGGRMDSQITVTGYPDVEYKPIECWNRDS